MARLTKQSMLEGIRAKLNSMKFEHTGDRELDVLRAGDSVLRSNGYTPRDNWHAGEYDSAVGLLSRNMGRDSNALRGKALFIGSNRVSRQVEVQTTHHTENGEIAVTYENQPYTISTHRTKTERSHKTPRWARSESDLAIFLRSFETFRTECGQMFPIVVNTWPEYHVNGSFELPVEPMRFVTREYITSMDEEGKRHPVKNPDGSLAYVTHEMVIPRHSRSLAVISRARRDVAANEQAAALAAAGRQTDRDAMRRENPPARPAVPAVKPTFPGMCARVRPARAKWFHVAPPVLVKGVTA